LGTSVMFHNSTEDSKCLFPIVSLRCVFFMWLSDLEWFNHGSGACATRCAQRLQARLWDEWSCDTTGVFSGMYFIICCILVFSIYP
jgi:hypothetical protein